MKKNNILILALFLSLIGFSACDSDSSSDELAFTELSDEDIKQKIEDDGIATMKEMDDMENLQVLKVLDEIISLDEEYRSAKIIQNRINSIATGAITKSALYEEEDVIVLADEFDSIAGIYVWDDTTEDFELETESSSVLSFEYTLDGGEVAILEISDFKTIATTDADLDDEIADIPTSVKVVLTIDGERALSYSFNAEYYSDNMLKYTKETLKAEEYAFESIMDMTDKSTAKESISLTHNDYIIFKEEASLSSTEDYDYYLDILKDEEAGNEMSEELLDAANFNLQSGNIKFVATANFAKVLEADENITDDQFIELLNNNIIGYLMFSDSKTMIAKSEFYMAEEYDDYSDTYETYLDAKFVFKDGSAVSEDYFSTGFEDLIEAFNDRIEE